MALYINTEGTTHSTYYAFLSSTHNRPLDMTWRLGSEVIENVYALLSITHY